MSKITNPVVLIHKWENSDTYAVAITSGSADYQDAILIASTEPDMTGDNVDTWSKTGYYMSAEIEGLREKLKQAEKKHIHLLCLVDDYDWQRQRLHVAAEKVIEWCRQEAEHRTGDPDKAENYACVKELRNALTFCESSGSIEKKCLAITLPDTSSKAFWSGTGKNETFNPEIYRRWVKEAIERDCVISGIGVEVK